LIDSDLHEHDRAEKALGSSVDSFDSTLGESGRLEGKPKKNACIKQAIHSPHSTSSLSLNEANAVSGMWNGLSIISPTLGFGERSGSKTMYPFSPRISNFMPGVSPNARGKLAFKTICPLEDRVALRGRWSYIEAILSRDYKPEKRKG